MQIEEKEKVVVLQKDTIILTKEEFNILQKASEIILDLEKTMENFYNLKENDNKRLYFLDNDYDIIAKLFNTCNSFYYNIYNMSGTEE